MRQELRPSEFERCEEEEEMTLGVKNYATSRVFISFKVAEHLPLLLFESWIVTICGSACPSGCLLQLGRHKTIRAQIL